MTFLARKILAVVSIGLTAVFSYAYYSFYFRWRDCFNEAGRCFDAETGVVYLEQSQLVWLPLALLSLLFMLYQFWRLWRVDRL